MATKKRASKKKLRHKPAYVFTWVRFATPDKEGTGRDVRPGSIIDETRPLSIIDDLSLPSQLMLSPTSARKRPKSIIDWDFRATVSVRQQLVPGTPRPKTAGAFALYSLPIGKTLAQAKAWIRSTPAKKFARNATCVLMQTEVRLQ